MENLENIIESILFVAGEAIDIADITSKIDVTKAEIKKAVSKLQEKYKEPSGIVLLEFNNKLQFASRSCYSDNVSLVLNPIRQRNLSKATLETASIVAYKQPVTRLEIEEIRGVNSDYAINVLVEHNLIEIVGRKDTVGKPALFGTTDEFLKRFNLNSIEDLPDYNDLLEKVQVVRNNDDRLYNHYEMRKSDSEQIEQLNKEIKEVAMAQDQEEVEDVMIGELEQENLKNEQVEEQTIEEKFDAFAEEVLENELIGDNEFEDMIEDDEELLDDDYDELDDFEDDDFV